MGEEVVGDMGGGCGCGWVVRALGPSLVFWNFRNIWVYLFATFFGGVAGAVVYEHAFLWHQPPGSEEEVGKL